MTIAAGFTCDDGILLASDTLYTGTAKRYGRKLWDIHVGGYWVVFGGSGSEASLMRIKGDLEEQLKPSFRRREVIETVDEILGYVIGKQPPSDRTDALIVLKMGPNAQPELFETFNAPFISPVGARSRCVGYAQGLGEYVSAMLFENVKTCQWARVVAAYLIKQAKDYSGYCDGDTHLLEVPVAGPPSFTDDQAEVRKLEARLAPLNTALQMVLPDGTVNDDTLELRLRTIIAAIEKASRAQVIRVPTGEFNVTTGPVGSSGFLAPELPKPQIRYSPPEEEK